MRIFYRFLSILAFLTCGMLSSQNLSARENAPAKVTPDDPSDISLKFEYVNGDPAITVTFKAPLREKSYLGEGALLTVNIDKIELNRREKGSYSWETVHTFTDIAPGTQLTYSDTDIQEGLTYEYNPLAYIGEDTSSSWNYEEIYAGVRPEAPKVEAKTFRGSAPVTLTITAPTLYVGGDPIDRPITELEITRAIGYGDFTSIHTIANPAAGQTYEWVDEDYKNLTDGSSVHYEVFAKIGIFSSTAGSANVTLSVDTPSSPDNVTVQKEDGGVTVKWSPVTTGAYGYWFDPAEVTYNVYRAVKGGAEVKIASNLKDCEFFDDLNDVESLNFYYWKVCAENSKGEGYGTTSDELKLGDAPSLPFVESFNTPGSNKPSADNLWVSESIEGWYKFEVDNNLFFWNTQYEMKIYAENNEDGSDANQGFLIFEGSSWSATESIFTSTSLESREATKAALTFSYFVIPQSKSTLHIELVNPATESSENDIDANATILANITMDGDELGWTEYTIENINLSDLEKFMIRLHAFSDPDDGRSGIITPVCVDNIKMIATETSEPDGISDPAVDASDFSAVDYFDLQGRKIANPEKGRIVIMRLHNQQGTYTYKKIIF